MAIRQPSLASPKVSGGSYPTALSREHLARTSYSGNCCLDRADPHVYTLEASTPKEHRDLSPYAPALASIHLRQLKQTSKQTHALKGDNSTRPEPHLQLPHWSLSAAQVLRNSCQSPPSCIYRAQVKLLPVFPELWRPMGTLVVSPAKQETNTLHIHC